MKKLPEGYKALPPGVEVYSGRRRFRYSCPIDLHPDNFKKAMVTKLASGSKEKNTNKESKEIKESKESNVI